MGNKHFSAGVANYWWIPLLTGILSIGIGIWCLCSPVESLPVLAYAFSICLCAAGLFNFTFAFANSSTMPGWGWSLAYGIIEIICGIWLLTLPLAVMTTVFIYAVGIYIIFMAINAICESCMFYSYSSAWIGWLIALLLIAIVCSFIFLAGPIAGGIAVWLYIGISFICFGIYRILISGKIRSINRRMRR